PGGTLTLLGSGLIGTRLTHSPVAAFWAMAAGAKQTDAAAVSTMRRKTFTAFLLGCVIIDVPRFPPMLCSSCVQSSIQSPLALPATPTCTHPAYLRRPELRSD